MFGSIKFQTCTKQVQNKNKGTAFFGRCTLFYCSCVKSISMKIKFLASFLFTVSLGSTCFAQLEKTIHQTFDLGEKTAISLDLYGEYAIIPWAGNNILVETNVQLYNSTASVLKHFIEKDLRYQIDSDTASATSLTLISHDKKRASLRTKTGAESTEIVVTKVFVPDVFIVKDQKTLIKEEVKE